MAAGLLNKQIAAQLGIREVMVKVHACAWNAEGSVPKSVARTRQNDRSAEPFRCMGRPAVGLHLV